MSATQWKESMEDEELFLHALSRPATARLGLACLGQPPEEQSDRWVRRALALLEAGLTEEDVFHASEPIQGGTGSESRLHELSLKRFRPLQAHADIRIQRIANTAVAQLTQMRDDAVQRVRVAAVREVDIKRSQPSRRTLTAARTHELL